MLRYRNAPPLAQIAPFEPVVPGGCSPVGTPDVCGYALGCGRFIGIEVKVEGNRTEKERAKMQRGFQADIVQHGAGEIGMEEVGAGEIGVTEIGAGEIEPGQVDADKR